MPGDGPIPKRANQRRRKNKPEGCEILKAPTNPVAPAVPTALAEWHPIARTWYESLAESGQAQFYEPSDWATASYIAEAMSRNLHAGRFSGQLFAAVLAGMTELLTTEGARRRARIELERGEPKAELPGVASMAKYRKAAAAKGA